MPPVQLNTINKIVSMCEEITTDNNYLTDVREVNAGDVPLEQISQFPCINVNAASTTYLNPVLNEAGKLIKTFTVLIEAFIREDEPTIRQTKLINMLADLETRFADDTVNGNTNFNQTATAWNIENNILIAQPVSAEIFDLESYKDTLGVSFALECKFRQKRDDNTSEF